MPEKQVLAIVAFGLLVIAGLAAAVVYVGIQVAGEVLPELARTAEPTAIVTTTPIVSTAPTPTSVAATATTAAASRSASPSASAAGFRVTGRLVNASNGSVVVGATVQAYRGETCCIVATRTVTNTSGDFELRLSSGFYRVQFIPSIASGLTAQFWRGSQTFRMATVVSVPEGTTAQLTMSVPLQSGFRVSGTLTRAKKDATDGTLLYVWTRETRDPVLNTLIFPAGPYAVRLPNGAYTFRYFVAGPCCDTPAASVEVDVKDGDVVGVDAQVP